MLYVGVTQYVLQRQLLGNSIPIEVEVVKSEVFKSVSADTDNRTLRDNSTISYRPDVRFRYSHEGKDYESDLLRPTIIVQSFASADSASEELRPFPVGSRVPAFLNTQHPDQAYLIRESSAGPIVFMILGVLLPPLAWFVGKYI